MVGLMERGKNPQALLSLCVRPLFCMHPQFPQAWTALHSHAAVAPGLWCWGAMGLLGPRRIWHALNTAHCLHANGVAKPS